MPAAARTISRRDIVMLGICLVVAVSALTMSERFRDPIGAPIRRTLLAPLLTLQHDAELTRLAWHARAGQTLQTDSLAVRALALPAAESENARLRRLLGLGERLRWGFVPAEALQGRGITEEYAVTLSTGGARGVRPFNPVVTAEGLVGIVKSVDPSFSTAILWAHPDFRASAMAADGSVFGIVAAHAGGDPERYLLELRGVPMRTLIATGTVIVTSGLGGTFPRGIPVGVVLTEIKTSELWARTYLLRPAVSPAELTSVMVLLPERARAGVEPAWRGARGDSLAVADQPRREGVAAADSAPRRRRGRRDTAPPGADSAAADSAPARADTITPGHR